MTDKQPEHTHEYSIPVEWEYINNVDWNTNKYPIGKKVTKLKCRWCKEVEDV